MISVLLPVLAFCSSENDDLFYFSEQDDSSDYLIGLEDHEEFDGEALSLFEKGLDEGEDSQLPWSVDEAFLSDVDSYVEKRATQLAGEFEELYTYDVAVTGDENRYTPSLETIPSDKRALFSRPKVVESKSTERTEPVVESKREEKNSSEIALRPSRFRKGQPKAVTSKEKILNELQAVKKKTIHPK